MNILNFLFRTPTDVRKRCYITIACLCFDCIWERFFGSFGFYVCKIALFMMTFVSFCGSFGAVFVQLSEKITLMILWFEYFETFT